MRNGTQPGTRTSASPMSALGQKRTCAVQNGMSALPPKADIGLLTRSPHRQPIADLAARLDQGSLRSLD